MSLYILPDCPYSHPALEVTINSRKHCISASSSSWDSVFLSGPANRALGWGRVLGEQGFAPRCSAAQCRRLQPSAGGCQHLVSGTAERSKYSSKGDLCCRKLCEHNGNCQGCENLGKMFLRCRWAVSCWSFAVWRAEGGVWTGRTSSDVAVGVWRGHVCCLLFHFSFSGFLPCGKSYRKCIADANLVLGEVQQSSFADLRAQNTSVIIFFRWTYRTWLFFALTV